MRLTAASCHHPASSRMSGRGWRRAASRLMARHLARRAALPGRKLRPAGCWPSPRGSVRGRCLLDGVLDDPAAVNQVNPFVVLTHATPPPSSTALTLVSCMPAPIALQLAVVLQLRQQPTRDRPACNRGRHIHRRPSPRLSAGGPVSASARRTFTIQAPPSTSPPAGCSNSSSSSLSPGVIDAPCSHGISRSDSLKRHRRLHDYLGLVELRPRHDVDAGR